MWRHSPGHSSHQRPKPFGSQTLVAVGMIWYETACLVYHRCVLLNCIQSTRHDLMNALLDVRNCFSCTSHRRINRGGPDKIYRQLYRSSRVDTTQAPGASEKALLFGPERIFTRKMGRQPPWPYFDALAKQGGADWAKGDISVVKSITSEIA